jgi:hypothetical protein
VLDDQVERVIALEDLIELHEAAVLEGPHNVDFVDETLAALELYSEGLLGEGLDGDLLPVLQAFSEVHLHDDCSTVAELPFPIFLEGFTSWWKPRWLILRAR